MYIYMHATLRHYPNIIACAVLTAISCYPKQPGEHITEMAKVKSMTESRHFSITLGTILAIHPPLC